MPATGYASWEEHVGLVEPFIAPRFGLLALSTTHKQLLDHTLRPVQTKNTIMGSASAMKWILFFQNQIEGASIAALWPVFSGTFLFKFEKC